MHICLAEVVVMGGVQRNSVTFDVIGTRLVGKVLRVIIFVIA